MNQIKLVVFDLDGTIMDSGETIYLSTIKTFETLKLAVNLPRHELDKRIGAHFKDIFDELNIEVDDIEGFIDVYKTLYFNFIDTTILYPNIEKLLALLKSKNILIALLTTKAQDQADLIIDHFNLRKYFNYVLGRRIGLAVKPSPEPLLHICKTLSIEPQNTLMVGDSELDIQCGKAAGTKTCGVTWGYRNAGLLEIEKPDYLISIVEEFEKSILK
jgi:HAD superfamily hydrolase (TIGR01509 family)